jgi:aldose 1-epimerase
VVDKSLYRTTELEATIADEIFFGLENRVRMLGEYAGKLLSDPEAAGQADYAAPDPAQNGEIVAQLILADGVDGFPGNLKTFLTFSVTDDDGVSIDYRATTDKPTVCNLSHHVYFNLDGFPAENVLNHVVWINADAITETDSTLIPTGRLLPVDGTPYDFRSPVALGSRQVALPAGRGAFGPGAPAPEIPEGMVRSFDQNFCLNHSVEGQVEKVASVYSPASGRRMEVFSDQPGLQFFTGNRLAFAMESQLYPDTLNRPEFPGKAVLRPGETYHHTVIYKFSR